MAAIGSSWAAGSWADPAWGADAWAGDDAPAPQRRIHGYWVEDKPKAKKRNKKKVEPPAPDPVAFSVALRGTPARLAARFELEVSLSIAARARPARLRLRLETSEEWDPTKQHSMDELTAIVLHLFGR